MKLLQLAIFTPVPLSVKKKKNISQKMWLYFPPSEPCCRRPSEIPSGRGASASPRRRWRSCRTRKAASLRPGDTAAPRSCRGETSGKGWRGASSRCPTCGHMQNVHFLIVDKVYQSVSKKHTNKYLSSRTTASRGSFNISKKAKNNKEQQCVSSSNPPGKQLFLNKKIPKNIECVASNLE